MLCFFLVSGMTSRITKYFLYFRHGMLAKSAVFNLFSSVDRNFYYQRAVLDNTVTLAAFDFHIRSNSGVVTGKRSSENQSDN